MFVYGVGQRALLIEKATLWNVYWGLFPKMGSLMSPDLKKSNGKCDFVRSLSFVFGVCCAEGQQSFYCISWVKVCVWSGWKQVVFCPTTSGSCVTAHSTSRSAMQPKSTFTPTCREKRSDIFHRNPAHQSCTSTDVEDNRAYIQNPGQSMNILYFSVWETNQQRCLLSY